MDVGMIFDALGNPIRRRILSQLRGQTWSMVALSNTFEISRPAISKHVKILREANLLSVEVEGRTRMVSLRRDGFDSAHLYLDEFWKEILHSFSQYVDQIDE